MKNGQRDNQINWRAGSWKDKLRDPDVYVCYLLDNCVYYIIFLLGKNSLCPCLHPLPPILPPSLAPSCPLSFPSYCITPPLSLLFFLFVFLSSFPFFSFSFSHALPLCLLPHSLPASVFKSPHTHRWPSASHNKACICVIEAASEQGLDLG